MKIPTKLKEGYSGRTCGIRSMHLLELKDNNPYGLYIQKYMKFHENSACLSLYRLINNMMSKTHSS